MWHGGPYISQHTQITLFVVSFGLYGFRDIVSVLIEIRQPELMYTPSCCSVQPGEN